MQVIWVTTSFQRRKISQMIEIKDLHKSYKTGATSLHVLKGINFNVKEGELVSIMGSSGSGKSTLLNILGMLDEADTGSYMLDNVPIKNLNEKIAAKYRNKFLGFIFQSFNLIPVLNVEFSVCASGTLQFPQAVQVRDPVPK